MSKDQATATAKQIVANLDSAFVTDATVEAWIVTAIMEGYAQGRREVYEEEMRGMIKHPQPRPTEGGAKNRHERRREAVQGVKE